MKGLQKEADKVKKAGRYGDTELVHINKDELKGLASMVPMTRNPETDQPEMWVAAALTAIMTALKAVGIGAATAAGSEGVKMLAQKYGGGGGSAITPGDVSGQTRGVSAPREMLPKGSELSLEGMEYGAKSGFGGKGGGGDDSGIMALLQQLMGGGGGGDGNLRNEMASVITEKDLEENYARGGAVGKVDDVFYFSSPQIQQMQMAPDPMTQNMGNMLGQQQQGGAPVPATVPQIQQMALGGPVRR